MVEDLWFRVEDLWFRAQDLWSRCEGLVGVEVGDLWF
jgi:hypothetical protein